MQDMHVNVAILSMHMLSSSRPSASDLQRDKHDGVDGESSMKRWKLICLSRQLSRDEARAKSHWYHYQQVVK